MTREDSEFLIISKTDFVACLADNPKISMAVIRDLVARVQRLTQQDIAQMVGASREMVNRIFKELRSGGDSDIEDKRVVLNKPLPRRW